MASIKGLQKTTLVDYPSNVACTIFISTCNFRCGFCHNSDIVNDSKELKSIPEEDILEFLKKRKGLLDGVCITGGEPLLYPNLEGFIKNIKDKGFKVKLDTNGTNPDKLKELIDANLLDYIAMDIKSDKEHYSRAAGVKVDIKKIEESVDLIRKSGIEYEFRSTIVPDFFNEKVIENIGKWLEGSRKYALQQFRSSMPLLDKSFEGKKPHEKDVLEKFRKIMDKYVDMVEVRV